MPPTILSSLRLLALLPALAMAQAEPAFGPSQSVADRAPAQALRAVWTAPLQGYVLDLRQREPRLFHVAGSACWPDAAMVDAALKYFKYVQFSPDQRAARVQAARGASHTLLARIDALPKACERAPDVSPLAVFDALDHTMREHFAFFAERRLDWPSAAAAARARLAEDSSEAAVFESLATLVQATNDPHVTLRGQVDGVARNVVVGRGAVLGQLRSSFEAQSSVKSAAEYYAKWLHATQQAVNGTLLSGQGRTALNHKAFWGVSRGEKNGPDADIGFLALTGLSGFTRSDDTDADVRAVDALLDEVFVACARCKAIILDLSQNRGGDDRVALAVAARFADEDRLAFTKQAVSSAVRGDTQSFRVQPSVNARWKGPVILVTDNVTVSAGEVLTLAMRALPHVNHVGGSTRGALSDALEKSLPNGWRFTLSNEIYRAGDGQVFEARGIPPAQVHTVFSPSRLFEGHAQLMNELVSAARR